MSRLSKNLKVVGFSLAASILLIVAIFGFILLRQVSPEKAQQASQKHFDDVRSKISSVPGYAIVKEGRPEVREIKDEIGSRDYSLSAQFLVQKTSTTNNLANVEAEVSDFAKRLPKNDYGITVENLLPTGEGQILLCVYASRYLNDDGSYIPQGLTDNVGKYIIDAQQPDLHGFSCQSFQDE